MQLGARGRRAQWAVHHILGAAGATGRSSSASCTLSILPARGLQGVLSLLTQLDTPEILNSAPPVHPRSTPLPVVLLYHRGGCWGGVMPWHSFFLVSPSFAGV